jgi:hypothetical protein
MGDSPGRLPAAGCRSTRPAVLRRPCAGLATEKAAQDQELAAAAELEALLWKAGQIAEAAGVRWVLVAGKRAARPLGVPPTAPRSRRRAWCCGALRRPAEPSACRRLPPAARRRATTRATTGASACRWATCARCCCARAPPRRRCARCTAWGRRCSSGWARGTGAAGCRTACGRSRGCLRPRGADDLMSRMVGEMCVT